MCCADPFGAPMIQTLVIPAQAGIRGRSSAISVRFSLWGRRRRIPAFAGMTRSSSGSRFPHMPFLGNYRGRGRTFPIPSRIVVLRRRVRKRRRTPGTRSCHRRNELCRGLRAIIPRHSRASGNPAAVVRHVGPFFLVGTPQADSRFRGSDEG